MRHRTLGRQGLQVSALGLGTMGMSIAYGPSDEDASIATIRRAYELGVTLFDTAELYGAGANEALLGKAVEGFRNKVILATKFGFDLAKQPLGSGLNSRPDNIQKVTDNSLRLLRTDHIDVLYQHRPDPNVPIEDVAGTVGNLIAAGKVRFFGLSEAGPDTIRRAHVITPVSVLQTEYSIFERDVEEKVLPVVRELGIGFVPYSPLGRGFLTDAVKRGAEYAESDMRRWDERFQGDNFEFNMSATRELKALAAAKGITVAQLALAWLLHQGDDIVPIPGTRSVTRLEENVRAVEVEFTRADLDRIVGILPHGAAGGRYPAAYMPTDW